MEGYNQYNVQRPFDLSETKLMRVVVSTIGRFHYFDLARELFRRDCLAEIFTAYPHVKLKHEMLPNGVIRTFPWFQTLYMGRGRLGPVGTIPVLDKPLAWVAGESLDAYVAANMQKCDVYIGQARSSLKAGRRAQSRGSLYICDRGSSHTYYQQSILRDEAKLSGMVFKGMDPREIAKEIAEFELADRILVPSTFVKRTFLEEGFDEAKIKLVPYGVDLTTFSKVGEPDPSRFDVLFVGGASLRKGTRYLLESFSKINHPNKQLTLAGTVNDEVRDLIAEYAAKQPVRCLGHVPREKLKETMSRSHVIVLPSLEEGLALVQAQAMACGCPVIATTNTGAEDLFDNGVEGYIVPVRDSVAIADRLQLLADDQSLWNTMSEASLLRVQQLGGWQAYGDGVVNLLEELLSAKGVA